MLPVILLALTPAAHAEDACDARALAKDVETVAPVKGAKTFTELAECDAEKAKKAAAKALPRMLAGGDGNKAALAAIEVGADTDLRAWLKGLEPDQRSRTVAWLGEQCAESEPVQKFFATAKAEMGMEFWTDRWHRGLAECRVEPIQKLLADAIEDEELGKDRTRLFNVLEVYARNLRGDALPALVKLASQTDDPEELTYLVNAFADTTGIGSVEGMDKEIAGKAAEAIRKLGPELPARAVEQSRITLRTLGDEEGSDQFAQHRWPDRFDEHYRYAVTVTEVAKCKNGKTRANLHVAAFDEGGMQWPDQIQPQLLDKLKYEWELDTADRCKGEGTFDVVMSEEPFESDEARDKWIEETVLRFEEKAGSYDKAKVFKHESFDY